MGACSKTLPRDDFYFFRSAANSRWGEVVEHQRGTFDHQLHHGGLVDAFFCLGRAVLSGIPLHFIWLFCKSKGMEHEGSGLIDVWGKPELLLMMITESYLHWGMLGCSLGIHVRWQEWSDVRKPSPRFVLKSSPKSRHQELTKHLHSHLGSWGASLLSLPELIRDSRLKGIHGDSLWEFAPVPWPGFGFARLSVADLQNFLCQKGDRYDKSWGIIPWKQVYFILLPSISKQNSLNISFFIARHGFTWEKVGKLWFSIFFVEFVLWILISRKLCMLFVCSRKAPASACVAACCHARHE